jgi:hypothetical protein
MQSWAGSPDPTEVVDMCHDWWMRRERRREERFDEELRYLLDEESRRPKRPEPVVEREAGDEPEDPDRVPMEAGTRP